MNLNRSLKFISGSTGIQWQRRWSSRTASVRLQVQRNGFQNGGRVAQPPPPVEPPPRRPPQPGQSSKTKPIQPSQAATHNTQPSQASSSRSAPTSTQRDSYAAAAQLKTTLAIHNTKPGQASQPSKAKPSQAAAYTHQHSAAATARPPSGGRTGATSQVAHTRPRTPHEASSGTAASHDAGGHGGGIGCNDENCGG